MESTAPRSRTLLVACTGPVVTTYRLDKDAARLDPACAWVAPGNVQYACVDDRRRRLYLATSDGGPNTAGTRHDLLALAIDPDRASLTPAGRPVPLPSRPIHCTLSPDRDCLLTVFNRPSGLVLHRIEVDGSIGDAIAQQAPVELGIAAHQGRFTPSGRHVVVSERGNEAIGSRAPIAGDLRTFRHEAGQLSFASRTSPQIHRGFEPRNVDFHPSGDRLFLVLESQNEIWTYRLEDDVPVREPLARCSTLASPDDARPGQIAGAVRVHPNGRMVYVANRAHGHRLVDGRRISTGGEDNIAVFDLGLSRDGAPVAVQHLPVSGIGPRSFTWDRATRIFVAANWMRQWRQVGDALHAVPASLDIFRMDGTGRLHPANRLAVDTAAGPLLWVGMVDLEPASG